RRPVAGETVCGDYPVAIAVGRHAALFGVLDGLGHGKEAETAALTAVDAVHEARAEPLDVIVQKSHRALTTTRGVAMTLARIDFQTDTLSWIGIGNVTADLVAKSPSGVEVRSSALLSGGIVGYRLPQSLVTHQVSIAPGDLLLIASDGLTENHLEDIDFAAPAIAIAEKMLGVHSRETDDALVLAARHRGATS